MAGVGGGGEQNKCRCCGGWAWKRGSIDYYSLRDCSLEYLCVQKLWCACVTTWWLYIHTCIHWFRETMCTVTPCSTIAVSENLYSLSLPQPLFTPPTPTPIPKGDWGCLMSLSCVESQGCHWVPLSYLLSCFSARSSLSFCLALFQLMVQSPDVFQDILQYLSLTLSIKKQTFFVWLLLSRFEMMAGWRHVALAFAIIHTCV